MNDRETVVKVCGHCGVKCVHNKCRDKERDYRCTYCGHPANVSNAGTPKRLRAESVRDEQTAKARRMRLSS